MMASLLALQSDELAEAAKKTSALESDGLKTESKADEGKPQPVPIEGRHPKDYPPLAQVRVH